jgi:hypothetical protein
MLPISNGKSKSNGRVGPMDEDVPQQVAKQEIDNMNLKAPNDPEVVKQNSVYNLFEKDQNNKELGEKEKPQGPKLKTFEIVCCFQLKSIIFIVTSSFLV